MENFALTSTFGITLYALLIMAFSMFYSQITISPEETAENFQKSGTFILGVQPGANTEKYLTRVTLSMSMVGGAVLTMIAILPFLLQM
jgi:preprotein translocase subunit SecY